MLDVVLNDNITYIWTKMNEQNSLIVDSYHKQLILIVDEDVKMLLILTTFGISNHVTY